MPDVGSIGLSFSPALGLLARGGFPSSRNGARGRQVGRKWRQASAIEMAPALLLLARERRRTRNENQRDDGQPGTDKQRLRCGGALRPEGAKNRKKALGGRRNPLKRLDSAKEIQGFSSIVFG
jgi:hypothetical protein